jgi:hypothetical protein
MRTAKKFLTLSQDVPFSGGLGGKKIKGLKTFYYMWYSIARVSDVGRE